MFSVILNVVGSALHLYCAWRVGSLPIVRRRVGFRGWWLAGAVVWVLYIAGVLIGDEPGGLIAWVLSRFAIHWLKTLFLLGLCLLAVIALVQGLRPPVVTHHEVGLPGC